MASKRQLPKIGFSHTQSASDFNSKAERERREQGQQDRQTRRRPATAQPAPHSSNSADRDRLRSLPRPPSLSQVDSGAHSLNSSTGDLVQDPDFLLKGDLLIQKFSEAIKSGEESHKKAKNAEAENAVLRKEIQELRQALDGMKRRCEKVRSQYMNIPPKEALICSRKRWTLLMLTVALFTMMIIGLVGMLLGRQIWGRRSSTRTHRGLMPTQRALPAHLPLVSKNTTFTRLKMVLALMI